jgi:hypothetical protein
MADICISYRRSDSQAITGRIFDRLIAHFGKDSIFIDIDNIPAGIDFRQFLGKTLLRATVLLAIVGPKWLGPVKGSPDRIHDETDPVRVELETALRARLTIIPVLIGNRKMPTVTQVPPSLKEFVFINAVTVDPGVDFDHHIQRLIFHVEASLAAKGKAPARAPAAEAASARRIAPPVRPNRLSGPHSVPDRRTGQAASTSRERRIPGAGEASRPPDPASQPSGAVASGPPGGMLSRLPPRLRLPLVAGATVLGLGLAIVAFLALNAPQTAPASAPLARQTEGPPKQVSGKCGVEGFSLDLRNCR